MIDNKKLVYVGIGLFFLLIAFNSTKKIELEKTEKELPNTLSFDHSTLPDRLKPPKRFVGENLPKPAKPIKTNFSARPKFDL